MIVDRMQVVVLSKSTNGFVTLRYVLRSDLPFPVPMEGVVITVLARFPKLTWKQRVARFLHKYSEGE